MDTEIQKEKDNVMILSKGGRPTEYCDVVTKTADPAALHKLALKSGIMTKTLIISNPHTSIETLEYLTHKDPDRKFLWHNLAKNTKMTGSNLSWIYEQATRPPLVNRAFPFLKTDFHQFHESTLKAIAGHPNTLLQTLNKLTKNKNPYIRFEVSKNPNLTPNQKKVILDHLIDTKGEGDGELLLEVLSHPDLHRSIRNVVIDGMVKEEQKKPVGDTDYCLLNKIAGFKKLSAETVNYLSSIENLSISSKVLLNNNLPNETKR